MSESRNPIGHATTLLEAAGQSGGLETALRQRATVVIWVKHAPWLRNLHADPRWPSILKKMNLWDGPAR